MCSWLLQRGGWKSDQRPDPAWYKATPVWIRKPSNHQHKRMSRKWIFYRLWSPRIWQVVFFPWQVQYNMVIGRTKVITSGSKDDFQGTIGRFSLHLVAQTTRGLTSVNEGPMVSPGPQLNRYICFSSCCIENYIDLVHSTWDPISEAKQKQRESNVNPIISHVWIRAEAIGTLWPSPNVSTESRVMALTKKTISMTILITIPTATVCQIRIQFPYEILSFFDSPSISDDFGWLAKDIQPDWHWCWDGRLEADFSQSTTADAQAIKE